MQAGTGRIRYEDAKTLDGLFRERAKQSADRPAYVDFNPNTGIAVWPASRPKL